VQPDHIYYELMILFFVGFNISWHPFFLSQHFPTSEARVDYYPPKFLCNPFNPYTLVEKRASIRPICPEPNSIRG
jgi:hypothetical protein